MVFYIQYPKKTVKNKSVVNNIKTRYNKIEIKPKTLLLRAPNNNNTFHVVHQSISSHVIRSY